MRGVSTLICVLRMAVLTRTLCTPVSRVCWRMRVKVLGVWVWSVWGMVLGIWGGARISLPITMCVLWCPAAMVTSSTRVHRWGLHWHSPTLARGTLWLGLPLCKCRIYLIGELILKLTYQAFQHLLHLIARRHRLRIRGRYFPWSTLSRSLAGSGRIRT